MDEAVIGDVMRLMKSADVQRMMSEMSSAAEASPDGMPANLDQMISNMARGVLRTMTPGIASEDTSDAEKGSRGKNKTKNGTELRHSLSVSIAEAYAGKTRKLRAKRRGVDGKLEPRELRVAVPAGCTDGYEVVFDGDGDYDETSATYGRVVVCVSVGKKEGAWARCGANLFTTQRVSLSDAQSLRYDLVMPWGSKIRVAADRSADTPLVGWHKIEGAGLGPTGDAYVNLRLEMPEKWGSVPDLKPHIASLLPPIEAPEPEQPGEVERSEEGEAERSEAGEAERSEDREAGEAGEAGEAERSEDREAGEAGEAERSEEERSEEERVRCVTLVRATANEAALAASVV
jgi:DnaJ-class molecular chaperone